MAAGPLGLGQRVVGDLADELGAEPPLAVVDGDEILAGELVRAVPRCRPRSRVSARAVERDRLRPVRPTTAASSSTERSRAASPSSRAATRPAQRRGQLARRRWPRQTTRPCASRRPRRAARRAPRGRTGCRRCARAAVAGVGGAAVTEQRGEQRVGRRASSGSRCSDDHVVPTGFGDQRSSSSGGRWRPGRRAGRGAARAGRRRGRARRSSAQCSSDSTMHQRALRGRALDACACTERRASLAARGRIDVRQRVLVAHEVEQALDDALRLLGRCRARSTA